jgi:DNA-binding response OmpR family regulator
MTMCPTCEGTGEVIGLHYDDISMFKGQVTRRGELISLTPQEYAVLEYFISNRHVFLSKEQIYQDAWHGDKYSEMITNTVQTTICALRKKLGEPDLIQTVRGHGYVLDKRRRT